VPETDRAWISTPQDNFNLDDFVGDPDYLLYTMYCEPIIYEMADTARNDSGYAPKSENTPEVKKSKKESRGVAGAVKTWLGTLYK
jgi:hypothetical protein